MSTKGVGVDGNKGQVTVLSQNLAFAAASALGMGVRLRRAISGGKSSTASGM
jgi:hypothetical protein